MTQTTRRVHDYLAHQDLAQQLTEALKRPEVVDRVAQRLLQVSPVTQDNARATAEWAFRELIDALTDITETTTEKD